MFDHNYLLFSDSAHLTSRTLIRCVSCVCIYEILLDVEMRKKGGAAKGTCAAYIEHWQD